MDDEVGFTRLLKLAAAQYDIRTENDPLQAVKAAAEFHPDLILMDRFMPKVSGDTLLKKFEQHPKLQHIPIAFVTGTVPRDEKGRSCTRLYGRPVLMKPISIEQIEQCVRECVG